MDKILTSVLGFKKSNIVMLNLEFIELQNLVNNSEVNSLKMMFNIFQGSLSNNCPTYSTCEFFPDRISKKIIYTPINLIYYRLNTLVIVSMQ